MLLDADAGCGCARVYVNTRGYAVDLAFVVVIGVLDCAYANCVGGRIQSRVESRRGTGRLRMEVGRRWEMNEDSMREASSKDDRSIGFSNML